MVFDPSYLFNMNSIYGIGLSFSLSASHSPSESFIYYSLWEREQEEVSDNNLSSGWSWAYFWAMKILSGLLFPFWILLSANWLGISISWKCKTISDDRKKRIPFRLLLLLLLCGCSIFLYSLSISLYVFISHWVLSKYLHSYFVFAMASFTNW